LAISLVYSSGEEGVISSFKLFLPAVAIRVQGGGRHPVLYHSCTVTGSEKVIGVAWHLLLTPLC
jgi:hypothetical protein